MFSIKDFLFFSKESYVGGLAFIIFLLVLAVATFFRRSFTYWESRGVYAPAPSVPFGNIGGVILEKIGLGERIKQVHVDIKNNGFKYGGFYFFCKPVFVPVDLDIIKHIFNQDFNYFTDHVGLVNEKRDPISGNLFFLKGSRWRNLRAKLTPTFTSGKMKMMLHTLIDCSAGLLGVVDKAIERREPIDIKEIVSRFTTDVIGSCGFGVECNSLKNPDSEFRKKGKAIFTNNWLHDLFLKTSFVFPEFLDMLGLRVNKKEISNFFINLVEQTIAYREKNNVTRKDFLHLLIQLKNNVKIEEHELGVLRHENGDVKSEPNGTALTINEVAAQAFVFFAAGFETSSTTTTFCLYELSYNQEIQDTLRGEIARVLEEHKGEVTYNALAEMTYMDQCINETLRKYPPVPLHTRECSKTYKIPNSKLVLEKGSYVYISPLGIHYDPEIYPDPDRFDPERFSEENREKKHSMAWIPFGSGPRTCIGLRFGVMQTKVALVALLKNYQFSLAPQMKTPIVLSPKGFILSSKDCVLLTAQKL